MSNLEPGEMRTSLETELTFIERLLGRAEEVSRPVPYPADHGCRLAESLIPVVRQAGVLWVPDAQPPQPGQPSGTGWPGGDLPPTLREALGRHATGPLDAELTADLFGGQPAELVWTPSMRWPGQALTRGLRLADLAIKVLPVAYSDGLRLALDAHALLAAGDRRRAQAGTTVPGEYVPQWRRLLAETAAASRAAGDTALAGDLADIAAIG